MARNVRKWILALLPCSLLLLPGCQSEKIIPPAEMESIFAEFYLADAIIESYNSGDAEESIVPDSLHVYRPIIEKHGFTEEMFQQSLDHYLHDPRELTRMFKHVRRLLEQEADRPLEQLEQLDLEPAETEEPAVAEQQGDVVREIREGTEPDIERESVPEPPREPVKTEKSRRKRLTGDELKRLEEELNKK